jgi:hypothetical protein
MCPLECRAPLLLLVVSAFPYNLIFLLLPFQSLLLTRRTQNPTMLKPKVTLTKENAALSRKDRFRAGGFEKARGFIVDRFLRAAKQPPLVGCNVTLKIVYKYYGNWSAKVPKLVLPAGDRLGRVGLHGLFAQKHAAICVCREAKIKHHWSKSEAKRPNNELRNSLHGEYPLWRLEKSFAA